jgi:hypothetical protein
MLYLEVVGSGGSLSLCIQLHLTGVTQVGEYPGRRQWQTVASRTAVAAELTSLLCRLLGGGGVVAAISVWRRILSSVIFSCNIWPFPMLSAAV